MRLHWCVLLWKILGVKIFHCQLPNYISYRMSADGPSPYAYMPRRKRNHSDSDEDHLDNLPSDLSDVSSEGEEAEAASSSYPSAEMARDCRRDAMILAANSTQDCVLQLEEVINAISDASIKLSWRKAQRAEGYRDPSLLRFTNMTPENYRYHGYCNYIELIHGYLGQGCHMSIPQCVTKHLRERHPDSNGKYTSYIPGRTGDVDEIVCALQDL